MKIIIYPKLDTDILMLTFMNTVDFFEKLFEIYIRTLYFYYSKYKNGSTYFFYPCRNYIEY